MPLDNCPTRTELASFLVGKLAADRAELVAEHVERCPTCEVLLDELERETGDDLLDHLRQEDASDSIVGEAACQDLIARAARIPIDSRSAQAVDEAAPEPPAFFGRYRVTGRIGSGGFGTVYQGFDDELQRSVAIKTPHPHRIRTPEDMAAYLAEARVVAGLDHPHIVPVHDVGRTDEGLCYVISKQIAGNDLRKMIKHDRVTHRQSVRIVCQIAAALEHAHEKQLVHRDVKPANILMDEQGEAFITDFGLAVREEDFAGGSAFAGTPAYMSPEQARGEGHRVDSRSDLYSLGVVLYELLTGSPPFDAEDTTQLLRKIIAVEPQPARQLDAAIAPELERICQKALAKRASSRYQSAREFADDLQYWLRSSDQGRGPLAGDSISLTAEAQAKVVSRGLRSFSAQDSSFFLRLLPGRLDRDGVPESIRFWRAAVGSNDADEAFSVGLIYGPSGSGKSSLVKAGLLPRLGPGVNAIYVECHAADTEKRLLNSLRRQAPDAPEAGLTQTLIQMRRRPTNESEKTLLVLDQFEHWLHAHSQDHNTELASALRQCDGEHIQCLLLVRDDFWMAISGFMRQLEVHLIDGHNSSAVALFDLHHARKVLVEFGRSFGRLPDTDTELTDDQHAFLAQSVEQLAEDGKIVPVRLALFAEMIKRKPWAPATLAEVGGAEGIGVKFLEESFIARSANPQHRTHAQAAQRALRSLLPDHGANIKGHMRSEDELKEACEYHDREADFNELIGILDSQLRLITPTDPRGVQDEVGGDVQPSTAGGQRFYQLSHDYLVGPIREWLDRQQRKSFHGRALLRLAERTAEWKHSRQSRLLPNLFEYGSFLIAVPSAQRKADERDMLAAATRRFALLGSCLVAAVAVLSYLVWETSGRIQGRRISQAMLVAQPNEWSNLAANEIAPYRRWTAPYLSEVFADSSSTPEEKLRASFALLAIDENQAEFLAQRLVDCDLDEFAPIREILHPYRDRIDKQMWERLANSDASEAERFRAGMALAGFVKDSHSNWNDADFDFIAEQLVTANPDDQRQLRGILSPLKRKLIRPLRLRFADDSRGDAFELAVANALVDFALDDHRLMANLISRASATQYRVIFPELQSDDDRLEPLKSALLELIAKSPENELTPESELTPEQTVQRGRMRAGAVVSLIRLGERSAIEALEAPGEHEVMSQFVHRLRDRGVTPEQLLECLQLANSVRLRFALLLALGEFELQDLPESERTTLPRRVADWYASDPSSAIHGASGWLLSRWGFDEDRQRVDQTPRAYQPNSNQEWFVEQVGDLHLTMIVFTPGEFVMGEPGSTQPEYCAHPVRLTRAYAISDREVTREQFERYIEKTSRGASPREVPNFSPTIKHPILGETWYEGVIFCRWLTGYAGRPKEDQCYELPAGASVAEDGSADWLFDPTRQGFRMATEAEWEYACRQDSSRYSFGDDASLMRFYGWCADNSSSQTSVGGRLRPNLRGVFDMHGNLMEWCHDLDGDYPVDEVVDPVGPPSAPNVARVLRGISWGRAPEEGGSWIRRATLAVNRTAHIGFRVVRTLPADQ